MLKKIEVAEQAEQKAEQEKAQAEQKASQAYSVIERIVRLLYFDQQFSVEKIAAGTGYDVETIEKIIAESAH